MTNVHVNLPPSIVGLGQSQNEMNEEEASKLRALRCAEETRNFERSISLWRAKVNQIELSLIYDDHARSTRYAKRARIRFYQRLIGSALSSIERLVL